MVNSRMVGSNVPGGALTSVIVKIYGSGVFHLLQSVLYRYCLTLRYRLRLWSFITHLDATTGFYSSTEKVTPASGLPSCFLHNLYGNPETVYPQRGFRSKASAVLKIRHMDFLYRRCFIIAGAETSTR